MSTTPLAVTEDLSKTIQTAVDTDDIKAAVRAEIEKQAAAVVAPTVPAVPAVVVPVAGEDAPKPFSRTESIGGKDFTFEAATELELERMVNNAYKVATSIQQPNEPVVPVVDPAKAAADAAAAEKAATDRAAAMAELELKFKRNEITTQEYLEQSGAVKDYLAKQGVPIEELRASVEESRHKSFEQSWVEASTVFAKSGNGWPGGERNKKLLGMKINELGLLDAADKVAALNQAYAALKADDLLIADAPAAAAASAAAPVAAASAVATVAPAVAAVVATAPAVPAVPAKTASNSSTLFGASSGAFGATVAAAPAAALIEIPKDATPQEIMAAWKEQQVKAGKTVDGALHETFGQRR